MNAAEHLDAARALVAHRPALNVHRTMAVRHVTVAAVDDLIRRADLSAADAHAMALDMTSAEIAERISTLSGAAVTGEQVQAWLDDMPANLPDRIKAQLGLVRS